MTRNDEMACFVSVDSREEKLTALSKEIWEYAEPGLKEKKSSAAIAKFLEEEGFRVQLGVGTVPPAICEEYGEGHPVIAYLGEYDSLPRLNQTGSRLRAQQPRRRRGRRSNHAQRCDCCR